MKTIAVIGAGALARIFCREVQNLLSEDYRIIAVMARNKDHAEALADQCSAFACTDINDLLAGFPDIVVEFAGRDAVKAYAQSVLAHGSDLVIASIGALADNQFRESLFGYAREHGRKVYIPKYIFPLSRVLSSFVTMSFSLLAILIVMLFTGAKVYWTILLFWVPLVFLFVFCCGIGLILSALSVYFRDITHLYGVLTLAWMYATPVFYDISILPANVQGTIAWNPMYHYITFFRSLILYGQIPQGSVWLICIGCSLAMLAVGLMVFRKMQRNFILYI